MIKIILVEDQLLVRKGISGLIKLIPDFEIVAEAEDGEQAIEAVLNIEHNIVLMDIKMPKLNGIEAITKLNEQNKLTPTILLTTFDDNELFLKGMRAGARGFLLKDVSIETLAETIRKVVNGETVVRPAITEKIINRIKDTDYNFESFDNPEKLTPRELEVLRLMAGGYNNKEIASVLCISDGVVKNHTSNIFFKLGVRDRTRAVLKGLELGLI